MQFSYYRVLLSGENIHCLMICACWFKARYMLMLFSLSHHFLNKDQTLGQKK